MSKNDSAIIAHIDMMQGIINRMADNSRSCKQWCILVVSAILTLATKETDVQQNMYVLCFIPIVMFCFLDSYYLDLERQARDSMKEFVGKLNRYEEVEQYVFCVSIGNANKKDDSNKCSIDVWLLKFYSFWKNVFCAIISFSVWPYYLGLALLVFYLQ